MILAIRLLVVVPLVGLLFGDDEWRKWDPLSDEFWEDIFGEEETAESTTELDDDEATDTSPTEPLHTIRERYARGELSDSQFEWKLELLLATETIEDVQDRLDERERESERLSERE